MIKTEYKKEMREVKIFVSEKFYCDKCGKEIFDDYGDIQSYKVVFKTGYNYGTDVYNYDYEEAYFCNECAVEIKKLLENIGVKFIDRNCC